MTMTTAYAGFRVYYTPKYDMLYAYSRLVCVQIAND